MKLQHTVYLEMRHKKILDILIDQEKIGNGKQGTPNYNKAILQAIEAIDTAREAHFQALLRGHRLYQWVVDDERFFSQVDRIRETKPKLYQKIVDGKVRKYENSETN
jgi:hypothetical protein